MADSPQHPDWSLPPAGSLRAARALASAHGLGHPLVAQILARRGLIGDGLVEYLHPQLNQLLPPKGLHHMEAAVKVLEEAIRSERPIVIYGDYDVDGTTAAALFESYLRHRGATVSSFIPMRNEGYGLTKASLKKIAEERHPQLLLTVDCGTSSRVEADYARSLGMDLVITDHHRPTKGKESAGILVNPHVHGDGFFQNLAGVGVAYKVVAAMHGSHPIAFLDLVAMGTVADVMPLTGENRVLVREGLSRLGHSRRPGLRALLATVMKDQPCEHGSGLERCFTVSGEDLAFQIGPRVNALGRVGLDSQLAVSLFNTRDEGEATEIAAILQKANLERREQTATLTDQAQAMVDPMAPVIVLQLEIFKGLAGLVAGRLAAEWNRPVIIVDRDGSGSARSVDGIDLLSVLQDEYSGLVVAAGHAVAMGISGVRDVTALRDALERHPWPARATGRLIDVDAVASIGDLDDPLLRSLELLEPTGQGNHSAVLAFGAVTLESVKPMGATKKHAKVRLRDATGVRSGIWFNHGERIPPAGTIVDAVGRPIRNEFAGANTIELQIIDLRPSEAPLRITLPQGS